MGEHFLATALLAAPAVGALLVAATLLTAALLTHRTDHRESSCGPAWNLVDDADTDADDTINPGIRLTVGPDVDQDLRWTTGDDPRGGPGLHQRRPPGKALTQGSRPIPVDILGRAPAGAGGPSWHLQARVRLLQGSHPGLRRRPRRGSAHLQPGRITFTPHRFGRPAPPAPPAPLAQPVQAAQPDRSRACVVVAIAGVDGTGARRPGLGAPFSVSAGARRIVVHTKAGAVVELVCPVPVSIAAVYALTQTNP